MSTTSPEALDAGAAESTTSSFDPGGGTNIGGSSTTSARTPYYRSPFGTGDKEDNPSTPTTNTGPFPSSHPPPPDHHSPAGGGGPTSGNTSDPKTCRICLDTTDLASDPELGRLISPCRCRGSSKYVHEGCLQQWRLTSLNSKSYYQCNTCGYQYQLRRLRWGKWVSSRALQLALTSTILSTTVYLLGFIADPIIAAYLNSSSLPNPPPQLRRPISLLNPTTTTSGPSSTSATISLAEHMLKGLTSLGLLGFLKVIFFLGPQSWWNIRNSGVLNIGTGGGGGVGARAGTTGRDRLGQLGWIVVALGVLNFFLWVWRRVREFTRGVLEKAAEEIVDIQEDEEVRAN